MANQPELHFMLREGEEFLSVNWMEHFGNIGDEGQLANIREHIELSLAASGIFAVLIVGEVLDQVKTNSGKQLAICLVPS
jgi:hypothetical protein